MNFYEIVLENKDEIIKKTKELLRFPSVLEEYKPESETPFGEAINDALHYMLDMAKEDGFITKNIENYAAHIEYGSGKDILGILCHLDVVPTGDVDKWTNHPFDPTVRDEKLFARGASDDKGPTMAAYYALKLLAQLDFTPKKRIRVILGTDEETAWRGIDKYFKTEEMPEIGFAPDASFPLIYGEKGIFSFDILGKVVDDQLLTFKSGDRYNVVPEYAECTLSIDLEEEFTKYIEFNGLTGQVEDGVYKVYGKSAHAMQPNLGINAAFILAEFLNEHIENDFLKFIVEYLSFDHLGERLNIDLYDDEMKDLTMNPAVFHYVDNHVKIGVNCRYPKGWDSNSALINIQAAAMRFGLKANKLNDMPVHYVDKKDPLVVTLHNAYKKYTEDEESELITIGGGTYSRALKKAVAFGPQMPGRKDVAHQVDEHIYIEDLLKATAIYMESIYELTKE